MNRRSILSTTALVAPALALAACAITPAKVATVEAVIAKIQAVMPYVSGIVTLAGAVVPGVSLAVAAVQTALNTAQGVFNTISSTMTVAAAQSPVSQIATIVGGAMTSAKQIAAALPANAQATANALLAEADSVIAELTQFAAGSVSAPAAPTVLPHMFIRSV